jgi:UDP-glucose:(heptosyl)LPS alpha-1,3-glucosyltransferase
MSKLNVLLAFPECHKRGGVERIMFECCEFLSTRGHNIQLLANKVDDSLLLHPNVSFRDTKSSKTLWFLNGLRYYISATRYANNLDFDVMNTHGCVAPVGGVPWVQSVHRAWLDVSKQLRPDPIQRLRQRLNPLHPILLLLEREHFAKRQYRKVIVTTSDVRADLHRLYSVPENDIEIVPNGYNPAEFNLKRRLESRGKARHDLGFNDNQFVLLFAANELERKGFYPLLRALSHRRDIDTQLLVVGRYDAAQAQKAVVAHNVSDRVWLCGSTSDMATYHAAADAFVLPTKYEAFCLAILEALGSGLPVITTTVPGAYNAIIEGVNGLILNNPEDDLELVSLISELGDSYLEGFNPVDITHSVEEYKWQTVLRRYEQILVENSSK